MSDSTQTDSVPATETPSLGLLAVTTYRRDLPRLLDERPGQWVAYHGDQLVGFAKDQLSLVQECIRRGYRGGDFIVGCIEPELPDIVDSPYPFE